MSAAHQALTQLRDPAPGELAGFLCQADDRAADLADFLCNDAIEYVRKNLAHVYLGWSNGEVAGFFALACGAVRWEKVRRAVRRAADLDGLSVAMPGVLLGRLAVDDRYQRQGLGTWLLDEALRIAKHEVAPRVGCRYLFLDANTERIEWYENRGFIILGEVGFATTLMGFDLFPPMPRA